MKKSILTFISALFFFTLSAQVYTSKLQVRQPTGTTINEFIGGTRVAGTLNAVDAPTNFFVVAPILNITENGENYKIGLRSNVTGTFNIPAGITDTGYRMGMDISAYVNGPEFQGTLATLHGVRIQYGNYDPATGGTINNVYGIRLSGLASGQTTLENTYGIHQTGASFRNYFQGDFEITNNNNATSRLLIDLMGASDNNGIELTSSSIASGSYWIKATGNDDADAFAVRGDGNVGIGTHSPSGKLHIQSSATGGSSHSNYDNLVIEETGAPVGLNFKASNDQNAGIAFGDTEDSNVGRIFYSHASDRMSFYVNDGEKMRIETGGNVGIGETNPQNRLHVNAAAGDVVGKFESTDARASLLLKDDATTNGGVGISGLGDALQILAGSGSGVVSTFSSDGNLGVGTTNPLGKLHVRNSSVGGTVSTAFDNIVVEDAVNSGLTFLSGNTAQTGLSFGDSDDHDIGRLMYRHTDDRMSFIVGDAEQMSIKKNLLGIGTTDPTHRLHVVSGATNTTAKFESTDSRASLILKDDATTIGVGISGMGDALQILAGSGAGVVSTFSADGNLGVGVTNPNVRLVVNSGSSLTDLTSTKGLVQIGVYTGTHMSFDSNEIQVSNNGVAGNLILQKFGGQIGIGTNSPSYLLHVDGQVVATNVSASSDRRWKKNITTISGASTTLQKINPVSFRWRVEEFTEKDFDDKKHYGVIAQELEEVLPELVNTDKEGYKSVDYLGMIGLLIKGFQERGQEIDQLKKELAASDESNQEEISKLETRLAKIEQLLNTPETPSTSKTAKATVRP